MIIFLYGKDDFRSLQKLKQIIFRHQKLYKTGLNLKFIDCKKHEFEHFRDQIRTKSMFQEKKLFVLKDIFSAPEFKQKGEISQKDPFFLFLQKNSRRQEFALLEGKKLEAWITKQAQKHKAQIKTEAIKLLIQYAGNNLWQISNEIKKLVNYKAGALKPVISQKDIKVLVTPKINLNIFKTIDAIAEKNKQKALSLIHQHLKKGDSPSYLLSMITFQFRNLLIVKEKSTYFGNINAAGARGLNMHPFVFRKSLWLSQKFSLEQLKKIYQKIFQIDLAIKTGKIEPELALDLLMAEL
jgi:DNA polymerase-3 subunit delta